MFVARLTAIFCCAAVWCAVTTCAGEVHVPLHAQIDQQIEGAAADFESRTSEPSTDAEFLRRVYLDLTGRIPSVRVCREFFRDQDSEKRSRVIDRLLESPEHVRHLQHRLDVMLMQRRPKVHVDLADWQQYLFDSIRANKPWDVLVKEILSADGVDADKRAAARFLLDRELKPDETTRDLGRVLLGRDLECAQCHDHPTIDDYAQRHYFGLSAFLNRSYLFTDPTSKQKSIGEKAEGTVRFTSVFTSVEAETAPRMLDLPPFVDPDPGTNPYVVKPGKKSRGVPTYSRRLLLADAVTNSDNRAFRLNIANRLWAMVMGRGLVEPLDMFHSQNPATHPDLLNLLADDLAANDYDMRRFIRELVLSETYQRSSTGHDLQTQEPVSYSTGILKPLTPEQLAWSVMQGTGVVAQTRSSILSKLQVEEPDGVFDTRESEFRLEKLVNDQLSPRVAEFVAVFASTNESSRFDATANQALFVLNGPLIGTWLQPAEQNLMARAMNLNDPRLIAEELFLSLLTRLPTDAEITAITGFINGTADERKMVLKQAARSMLSSAEFRFNH